jgi:hypothetical protein
MKPSTLQHLGGEIVTLEVAGHQGRALHGKLALSGGVQFAAAIDDRGAAAPHPADQPVFGSQLARRGAGQPVCRLRYAVHIVVRRQKI